MTTSSSNNAGPKFMDPDNQRQHQERESRERKHSGQSGSAAGRNNNSPRKDDRGERHHDNAGK